MYTVLQVYIEDGAAQGARTDANSAGSSKRPDTLIQITSPTSLARLPLLRFASNAGKAIGHTGQESSHRIKPVQIKKLNKQLLVDAHHETPRLQ